MQIPAVLRGAEVVASRLLASPHRPEGLMFTLVFIIRYSENPLLGQQPDAERYFLFFRGFSLHICTQGLGAVTCSLFTTPCKSTRLGPPRMHEIYVCSYRITKTTNSVMRSTPDS